jgi:hypothetical protein
MSARLSPLVYFEGSWSADERELIEAAAETAETAGLPKPSDALGAPWVATRQILGDTRLYMASRQRGDSALMDRSAEGLADRIQRFAEQKGEAPPNDVSSSETDRLFQLAYESTAVRPMVANDFRELLQKARAKNKRLGITGLLLYAQGRFFQVLEGPESAVRSLYDTIRDDERHTNVETLLTTTITARTFPDWEMGLDHPEPLSDEEHFSPFLQTGELPTAAAPIAEVVTALNRFRHRASAE